MALYGNVEDAYLYGSYARGDAHPESNIDILTSVPLSAEKIAQRRMDMAKITSELSLEYDITVSVAVKPAEQFERYKTVLSYYRNVIAEGILENEVASQNRFTKKWLLLERILFWVALARKK